MGRAQRELLLLTRLLLLLTSTAAAVLGSASPSSVACTTGACVIAALRDVAVSGVQLDGDVALCESDWGPAGGPPLLLKRNFLIVGRSAQQPVALDLCNVQRKLLLGNGTTIALRAVVLWNWRKGSPTQAPGLDVVAQLPAGEFAVLDLVDSVLVYTTCVPPSLGLQATGTLARPSIFRGSNAFVVPAAWPEPCAAEVTAPPLERCWALVSMFVDFGCDGYDLDVAGRPVKNGYLLHMVNTYTVCQTLISQECLDERGPLGCELFMYSLLSSSAPAQSNTLPAQSPGNPPPAAPAKSVLPVVLGCVLGGLALVALAMGAAAVVWRKQRPESPALGCGDADPGRHKTTDVIGACSSKQVVDPAANATRDPLCSIVVAAASSDAPRERESADATMTDAGRTPLERHGSKDNVRILVMPLPQLLGTLSPKNIARHNPQAAASAAALSIMPGRSRRQRQPTTASAAATEGSQGTASPAAGASSVAMSSPIAISPVAADGAHASAEEATAATAANAHAAGPADSAQTGDTPPTSLSSIPTRQGADVKGRGSSAGEPSPAKTTLAGPREVQLTARVLGKGAGGRVYEGVYDNQRVAVKLLQPLGVGMLPYALAPHDGGGSGERDGGAAVESEAAASEATGMAAATEAAARKAVVVAGVEGPARQAQQPPSQAQRAPGGQLESGDAVWSPGLLDAFRTEVELLGSCHHPNIVKLLAACVQPPRLCLVMELMETSLERLLYSRDGPAARLPLPKVLHITLQIALALEYLHPITVHRDLKPANVLLSSPQSPRPTVKVSDFGLARLHLATLVTQHPDAGTPAYIAPECYDVLDWSITHHADIYSLAVMCWEMLSGTRPWEGYSVHAIAFKVAVRQDRLPLDALGEHCPRRLQRLLTTMWDRVPERRPAAAEVVKHLLLVQEELRQTAQQQRHQQQQQQQQQQLQSIVWSTGVGGGGDAALGTAAAACTSGGPPSGSSSFSLSCLSEMLRSDSNTEGAHPRRPPGS